MIETLQMTLLCCLWICVGIGSIAKIQLSVFGRLQTWSACCILAICKKAGKDFQKPVFNFMFVLHRPEAQQKFQSKTQEELLLQCNDDTCRHWNKPVQTLRTETCVKHLVYQVLHQTLWSVIMILQAISWLWAVSKRSQKFAWQSQIIEMIVICLMLSIPCAICNLEGQKNFCRKIFLSFPCFSYDNSRVLNGMTHGHCQDSFAFRNDCFCADIKLGFVISHTVEGHVFLSVRILLVLGSNWCIRYAQTLWSRNCKQSSD